MFRKQARKLKNNKLRRMGMGRGFETINRHFYFFFFLLILDLFFFSFFLRYCLPGKKILRNKEKKTNL